MSKFKLSLKILKSNLKSISLLVIIFTVAIGVLMGINNTIMTLEKTSEKYFEKLEQTRYYTSDKYDGNQNMHYEQYINDEKLLDIYVVDDITKSTYTVECDECTEKSVGIDYLYAQNNNIELGDEIPIQIQGKEYNLIVTDLIYAPYYTNFLPYSSQILPDNENNGYIYIDDEIVEPTESNLTFMDPFIDEGTVEIAQDDFVSVQTLDAKIEQISSISSLFPILLFFVSILICYSSIKRIVTNNIMTLGILRAYGESEKNFFLLYLPFIFVIALLSITLGIVFSQMIVRVLIKTMTMLFSFPDYEYVFNIDLLLFGIYVIVIILILSLISGVRSTSKVQIPQQIFKSTNNSNGKFKKLKLGNYFITIGLRSTLINLSRSVVAISATALSIALIISAIGLNDTLENLSEETFSNYYTYTDKNYTNTSIYNSVSSNDYFYENNQFTEFEDGEEHLLNIIALSPGNNGYNIDEPNQGEALVSEKLAQDYEIESGDKLIIEINNKDIEVEVIDTVYVPVGQSIFLNIEDVGLYNGFFNDNTDNIDTISSITSIELEDDFKKFMVSVRSIALMMIFAATTVFVSIILNLFTLIKIEKITTISIMTALGLKAKHIYLLFLSEYITIYLVSLLIGIPLGVYLQGVIFGSGWGNHLDVVLYMRKTTPLIVLIFSLIISIVIYCIILIKDKYIDYIKNIKDE